MKIKNLWIMATMVSSFFLIATFSVAAADVPPITDPIGDVSSVDYLTGEAKVVTSSPDVTVANLDLIEASYTQNAQQVTLSLQVKGIIEDRGKIIDMYNEEIPDFNAVEYGFLLSTTEQEYTVSYSNKTGQLVKGNDQINLTAADFSVNENTLSITFSLVSANEEYQNLSVTTTFIKANFSSIDTAGLVYLSDVAPNPPLQVYDAYAPNIGSIGENIQFNGSVAPLTGQPPYTYHWIFGDQGSSTDLNPTHTYTKAGVYTFTFTVTDQSGASESQTGTITISAEGGGSSSGPLSNQMILFLAVLLIIIVIGVIIIVWIIRR
ncbi:MAG TPA: hypothetical protein DSN98_07545 [Thermoplasmata archaeon]|jgi:hypothetical protein|nr:MAG TPA: hypothetical protein DSN98_07545 [Thermoplasmata archaeon]